MNQEELLRGSSFNPVDTGSTLPWWCWTSRVSVKNSSVYQALVGMLKVLIGIFQGVRLPASFRSSTNSKPKTSCQCTDHMKSHSWMMIGFVLVCLGLGFFWFCFFVLVFFLFLSQDLFILTAVVPGHWRNHVFICIGVVLGFWYEDNYCDKSELFSPDSRELVNKLFEAICLYIYRSLCPTWK